MSNPEYCYPEYQISLPDGIIQKCIDMAPMLLSEVGFMVGNDRFLGHLTDQKGICIKGPRVYFDKDFVRKYIERFIAQKKSALSKSPNKASVKKDWNICTNGYSMMTIDVATEQLREVTCQDLRDMIKLANSFDIGGYYMVMPQDLPPLMRAIACFKICYESSDNIEPYDYQQPQQLLFLYEMHQVMDKTMAMCITIPSTLCVDPRDLDNFLDYYPIWKKDRGVSFGVLDYPMNGITKPISVPGCAAMCFAETLAVHILFNLFDPEIELSISLHGGFPTDMRHACWAFGSPRAHLFQYLNSLILPNLCEIMPDTYVIDERVRLETSSPAIDEQAALEKMAIGLTAAFQGAREFSYAGTLCVDDIYSGTQFVIDLEIFNYIKETIASFDPHPDIIDIEGLYEECRDAAMGDNEFISSFNTAGKIRNIIPSSDLIVREKLASWRGHGRLLKDRAREIALDRIKNHEPSFHLPDDKQRELDKIYARAKAELS